MWTTSSFTNEILCKEFSKTMRLKFEMSMMSELNFLFRIQLKQGVEEIAFFQIYKRASQTILPGIHKIVLNDNEHLSQT